MDITKFLELSSSNQVIAFVEFFLIFLFCLYTFRLIISWIRDRIQMKKLYKLLLKYKKKIKDDSKSTTLDISHKYGELLEEIGSLSPTIQYIWKIFDDTLFKNFVEDRVVIRKDKSANKFFNRETMVKHFDSKVFKSTADKLLFVGVIGSIVAIYYVVINLDSSAILGLKEALSNINNILFLFFSNFYLDNTEIAKLIDSFIFLVKIIGVKLWLAILSIGLAIVFSYKHKYLENLLDKKIDKIQSLVDEIFVEKVLNKDGESLKKCKLNINNHIVV